jgi:hypothetical protein
VDPVGRTRGADLKKRSQNDWLYEKIGPSLQFYNVWGDEGETGGVRHDLLDGKRAGVMGGRKRTRKGDRVLWARGHASIWEKLECGDYN